MNDAAAAIEDGAVLIGNVGSNDTDVDIGDTRTYSLVGAAPAGLTLNADGSYVFNPLDPAYQHLAAGATQTVVVTYMLADNHGGSDTATLTITVTGTNDAPVAANDVNSAVEDGAVITGNVGSNDRDVDTGATRTYALVGAAPAGLTFNPDGSYSFDPASYDSLAAGATQNVVVTYTMTDDQGATDTATLTITVTGVNDAPAALNDTANAVEDGAIVTGNVGTNDTDVDAGATRTYALVGAAPAGLTFNPDGSYSFDPGSYDSLAAGATQNVIVTYTMADDQGATDTATLTITVTGVNDAPDALNDIATAIEDGAIVTGNVGANDTDVDTGATRTYALVGAAPAGLTFNPDGSYSFDPGSYDSLAAGATQNVVVTYTMTDDQGATDMATLTITVTGVDDAGVAQPDAFVTTEAASIAGSVFADNGSGADSDVDGLVVSAVNGSALNVGTQIMLASGALLKLNADGTFVYDPNHAFDSTPTSGSGASNTPAHDSFNYTLAGGNTVSVNITLTGLDTDDLLVGTTGADVLIGGVGNDIYLVGNAADRAIEAVGEGTRDVVYASVSYELSGGSEIEVLSASDQSGTSALTLVGNALDQEIYGNAGANFLQGGGGTDYLIGLGGNDTYLVSGPGDHVVEAAGEGTRDVIYTVGDYTMAGGLDVEVLSTANQAGTGALNLTGSSLGQEIYGNDGVNVIDGGGGEDVLVGHGGNDTYFVDSAGDIVLEGAGGGARDTVYATASYALVTDQEIEVLSTASQIGTAAINLTGNNLANELYGNNGANVLNGGAGADYLLGYGGADIFQFTTALGGGNVDHIGDFISGTDRIALDDAVFTGIGALGTLSGSAFVTGTAAGDADDRIIYNSATGQLFFDADGSGSGAAVLFATVTPGLTLTASDFMVI